MLYRLDEDEPQIEGNEGFVAPNATLIGRVRLMARASVWFGAVLRGDSEWITIGEGSNVQDNSVLHTDPGFPLTVGNNVTIGHSAIVHGCTIGDGSLIGMGATVMNGAKIGKNCLIAAGSLISEGKEFPDNSLIRGAPGRLIGEVSEDHIRLIAAATQSYVTRALRYRAGLKTI